MEESKNLDYAWSAAVGNILDLDGLRDLCTVSRLTWLNTTCGSTSLG